MDKVLVKNIGQMVTPVGTTAQYGCDMQKLRISENVAIYCEDGTIKWIGDSDTAVSLFLNGYEDKRLNTSVGVCDITVIDAEGKAVLPGFVDSHTHFVFGGYRQCEFIERLKGTGYLDLMKMGGGIQSTVNATRDADMHELKELGRKRIQEMLAQGITTMEGKSGYGLDQDCELKQLRIMKELDREEDIDLVITYLGAHAVPIEYAGNNEEYVDFMIDQMFPLIRKDNLAEFCDVFCEDNVFSINESRKLLSAAKEQGLAVKIHADEIVSLGGAELAAELGAVSADHLLMISDHGIDGMIEKRIVATLLPNTAFCLAKPYAPARKLIDRGAAVALASDYNPGSCFTNSIPLMIALAVIYMNMTIEEVITALTINGAAALNRAHVCGSIEVGKKADFSILAYPDYRFLVYHTGVNVVEHVIKGGRKIR